MWRYITNALGICEYAYVLYHSRILDFLFRIHDSVIYRGRHSVLRHAQYMSSALPEKARVAMDLIDIMSLRHSINHTDVIVSISKYDELKLLEELLSKMDSVKNTYTIPLKFKATMGILRGFLNLVTKWDVLQKMTNISVPPDSKEAIHHAKRIATWITNTHRDMIPILDYLETRDDW